MTVCLTLGLKQGTAVGEVRGELQRANALPGHLANTSQEAVMKTSVALKSLLGAASLALPLMAYAESNVQTGAGALTATAHLDFQIIIPKILFLRIGTGSNYNPGALANNINVDLITFTATAANLGSGPISGTGGDLTGGVVTAALISNTAGAITFSAAANAAGLSDGAGDFIPFTQITTTAAAGSFATQLAPLALTNGTTTTTITPAGKTYSADAKWTFSYANNTFPPQGTYGGAAGLNNGRVTYTAAVP